MTPRWRNDLSYIDPDERYVGGVGRYDLWVRTRAFRVVWGERADEWDTYYFSTKGYYHREPGRPDGEDHANILMFLKLFAPELRAAIEEEENGDMHQM